MATREYVGAGGLRLHLDDPLSPQMAEQLAKGRLHLVPTEDDGDNVQETSPANGDGPGAEVERPAKNAPVDKWRAYAASRGMDGAEDATKAECQDYVQVLDDAEEAGKQGE